jgi:prepilin-type N-terminal cleavage/methylation domain-containing protein
MSNTRIQNNKGFTLIETLVAITILMISIAGPLTIAQKSLTAATIAKDQVIASFLAQEMIEQIKNDRDRLGFSTWITESAPCVTRCVLNVQTADGKYGTGAGRPSKFSITSTKTAIGTNEAKVVVTVSWNTGTIENVSTIQNHLFNVQL